MTLLIIVIALAIIFDYINGFHDAANSIATIVTTKVLSPFLAVLWAAFFNFVAFFIAKYVIGEFGIANTVAKTVFSEYITLPVILSGLLAAIFWNLLTWRLGIPSSSSHTLIGGFAGAAIAATIPKLTAGRFLDYYRPGNEFLTALAMLRELVHLRLRQKRPILDVEELCDAADTYPEAAERILSRLAEAGYVAPVTTEAGGRTQEWVLVADSQKTTLLRAFEFFAVSGGNSLVSSKMQRLAGKDGAVGILADWWKQFSTNEALNRPMAQLFALPGDEEESVSDGSLRNNSSRIQKS